MGVQEAERTNREPRPPQADQKILQTGGEAKREKTSTGRGEGGLAPWVSPLAAESPDSLLAVPAEGFWPPEGRPGWVAGWGGFGSKEERAQTVET